MLDEKEKNELFFRPFAPLSGLNDPATFVDEIRQRIDAQEYLRAEILSKDLIQLCLRGLRYFQTYDWLFLRGVITIGYVGWCVYCAEFLIRNHVLNQANIKAPNKMTTWMVPILSLYPSELLS